MIQVPPGDRLDHHEPPTGQPRDPVLQEVPRFAVVQPEPPDDALEARLRLGCGQTPALAHQGRAGHGDLVEQVVPAPVDAAVAVDEDVPALAVLGDAAGHPHALGEVQAHPVFAGRDRVDVDRGFLDGRLLEHQVRDPGQVEAVAEEGRRLARDVAGERRVGQDGPHGVDDVVARRDRRDGVVPGNGGLHRALWDELGPAVPFQRDRRAVRGDDSGSLAIEHLAADDAVLPDLPQQQIDRGSRVACREIERRAEGADGAEVLARPVPDPGVDPEGSFVQLVEGVAAQAVGQGGILDEGGRRAPVGQGPAQVDGGPGGTRSVRSQDVPPEIDEGPRPDRIVIIAGNQEYGQQDGARQQHPPGDTRSRANHGPLPLMPRWSRSGCDSLMVRDSGAGGNGAGQFLCAEVLIPANSTSPDLPHNLKNHEPGGFVRNQLRPLRSN